MNATISPAEVDLRLELARHYPSEVASLILERHDRQHARNLGEFATCPTALCVAARQVLEYRPSEHRDPLFPEGRPACSRCKRRPVYMGSLCGECYATTPEALALAAEEAAGPQVAGLRGTYLAEGRIECPGCGRIMSAREQAEQGECNDCHPGGAAELGGES